MKDSFYAGNIENLLVLSAEQGWPSVPIVRDSEKSSAVDLIALM
ncbi:hypothetical protein DOT_1785 [Desulfosporosinus sp. OT]|nr:hypothetical protein DOT_1785 [Desulfosporosinus sp. OT]